MTRYEMAQIVAKAMANGANVDKLAAEFADELDNLGVRVANLEKKADNVKITGEFRYHYAEHEYGNKDWNESKIRSRVWVTGQVNDDWSYTGMIQNEEDLTDDGADEKTTFQRAYVNGKLGGAKVQAGRYNLKVAEGNVYDNRFDGVQLSYGKDVKLTAGYGKATSVKAGETVYAELAGKVGVVGLAAGYYDFKWDEKQVFTDDSTDVFAVSASLPIAKDLKLGAMYLKGDDHGFDVDDDGYVATLSYKGAKAAKVGSWGLEAKYYDQGAPTYIDHTMNGVYGDAFGKADGNHGLGFKGYSVTANYTFAKNIVGQVEYYDLEDKVGNKDTDTLWAQVVFTF